MGHYGTGNAELCSESWEDEAKQILFAVYIS